MNWYFGCVTFYEDYVWWCSMMWFGNYVLMIFWWCFMMCFEDYVLMMLSSGWWFQDFGFQDIRIVYKEEGKHVERGAASSFVSYHTFSFRLGISICTLALYPEDFSIITLDISIPSVTFRHLQPWTLDYRQSPTPSSVLRFRLRSPDFDPPAFRCVPQGHYLAFRLSPPSHSYS